MNKLGNLITKSQYVCV